MNKSILIILYMLPLMTIMNLMMNQTHFLMTLLSLEGVTLSLMFFVPLVMMNATSPNPTMTIMILTFGACEASLGLSLMVAMSRTYGNDMMNALTLTKC